MPERTLLAYLKEESKQKTMNAQILAALIACFLINNLTLLGHPLPSQQAVAIAAAVNDKIVERAWRALQYEYCIILPVKGSGTSFVKFIGAALRRKVDTLMGAYLTRHKYVGFNHLNKSALARGLKGFRQQKQAALNLSQETDYRYEKFKEVPGLHEATTDWLSEQMYYDFKKEEVYYTDDASLLLTNITETHLPKRSKLVMINPLLLAPSSPSQKRKNFSDKFGRRSVELTVAELSQYCDTNNVPLVYISPPAPYPYDKAIFRQIWVRLNKLRQKYGFLIVVDDPYQDLMENPLIFEEGVLTEIDAIYYVAPLTTLDEKLETIIVVAASTKNISLLKEKYIRKAVQVALPIACAMWHWLNSGHLRQFENDCDMLITKRVALALRQFEKTGLFVQEHFDNQKAWFIYLEPRNGNFKFWAAGYLKKLGKKVINPNLLNNGHHFKKGIFISLSSFKAEIQQENDIETLILLLKDLIIYH